MSVNVLNIKGERGLQGKPGLDGKDGKDGKDNDNKRYLSELPDNILDKIDSDSNQIIDNWSNPDAPESAIGMRGFSKALITPDGVLFSKSYGNYLYQGENEGDENVERPVTSSQTIAVASAGKPIFGMILLKLLSNNIISESDKLVDVIPEATVVNKFTIITLDEHLPNDGTFKNTVKDILEFGQTNYPDLSSNPVFMKMLEDSTDESIVFEGEKMYGKLVPIKRDILLSDCHSERSGHGFYDFIGQARVGACYFNMLKQAEAKYAENEETEPSNVYVRYNQGTGNANSFRRKSPTNNEYIKNYYSLPIWPGQIGNTCYGSEATCAAQAIAEKATGQDIAELLKIHVTGPLEMPDTGFFQDPEFAATHQSKDLPLVDLYIGPNKNKPHAALPVIVSQYAIYPSKNVGAYLHASLDDLLKFYQCILNEGIYNGKEIFTTSMLKTFLYDNEKLWNQGNSQFFNTSSLKFNGVETNLFKYGRMLQKDFGNTLSIDGYVPGGRSIIRWAGLWGYHWYLNNDNGLAGFVMPSVYYFGDGNRPAVVLVEEAELYYDGLKQI